MDSVVERRPFKVGEATVDPVSRDARWSGGQERLQPQTLKVLLTLVSHRGEVVTRDELIQLCWDGRIVGDDVINRSILLLRHFAERAGGFEIETVPRTGYRLIEAQPGRPGKFAGIAAAGLSIFSRKRIAGATAALSLLIVGTAGLFAFERLSRPTPDAVMLKPFDVAGNAPLARTFAAGVFSDINSALSAASVNVVDPGASGQSDKAAFILSGRAELPGSELHLTAELKDARDHTVLWSTGFTRPANQVQSMQEQVADNLAAVLHCALDTAHQQGGVELDRDTIKLYLKACALQQSVDWPPNEVRNLLKQVTAREPRFALGWARLAFVSVSAAWKGPPQERAAVRREARMDAQTALRLDPRSGLAYEALTDLELGHVPFAQLHREFQKVLSFDPNNAFVINDDGELLMRMGSLDEGLQMFRRGVALDPLSPEQAADLIHGLVNDSRDSEAQAVLRRALRIWPDDNTLKIINVDYLARFGDPNTALSILNDPDARPQNVRDITLEAYRHLAEARKSRNPAQVRVFIAWLKSQVASGELGADFAAPHLASFGDVDGAFKLALAAPSDPANNDPEFLWEPESISLRRDPRFFALATKFHVADFWRTTQLWPDFCIKAREPVCARMSGEQARAPE